MIKANTYFFMASVSPHVLSNVSCLAGFTQLTLISSLEVQKERTLIVNIYSNNGNFYIDYACQLNDKGLELKQAKSQAIPSSQISGVLVALINDFFN